MAMPVELGFLGTGAITSALVTGLNSAGGEAYSIRLSPRNAVTAADLAGRYPRVSVATSNQEVVDACEIVVLAVRPQVARTVLAELRFRPSHHVISLVSGLPLRAVRELVNPAGAVARAVPLPSAAQRRSPTGVYPRDRVAIGLFAPLGEVFAVDSEDKFDALCTATATVSAQFAFADSVASWLVRHGIPPEKARDYMAQILSGLADAALEAPPRSFQSLGADHATPGGLNQQFLTALTAHGVFETLSDSLDAVLRRVTAESR